MARAYQVMKRTDSMRVKLSPEMVERFERLAVEFGMPLATLGAFAIAEFVRREEMKRSEVRAATAAIAGKAAEQFAEGEIEKVLEAVGPSLLRALSQPSLGLGEDEDGKGKP